MAWCKRDVSDFFRWNFFSFKSAWIFACAFQLRRKTFSCIVLWLKCSCSALLCSLCTLQYFVFVFLRNKVQTRQKKIQGNVVLLNWKAHEKIQALLKEKKFTWKSHLRPSCTKPFNSKASRALRPGLQALWGLASKALRPWYERPRARTYPRFFAKIEWPKELQTSLANLFIRVENCLALISSRFCCVFQK